MYIQLYIHILVDEEGHFHSPKFGSIIVIVQLVYYFDPSPDRDLRNPASRVQWILRNLKVASC